MSFLRFNLDFKLISNNINDPDYEVWEIQPKRNAQQQGFFDALPYQRPGIISAFDMNFCHTVFPLMSVRHLDIKMPSSSNIAQPALLSSI